MGQLSPTHISDESSESMMRPVGRVGISNVRVEELGDGVTADGGGGAGSSAKSVVDEDDEDEEMQREERSNADDGSVVSDAGSGMVSGFVTRSAGFG